MTKRILYLLIFVVFAQSLFAQAYQNEWIDYNKTYYKFKIGPFGYDIVGAPIRKGVVRIPQSTIAAAGLGNVHAEQFQLWRDGQEVPIFISTSTGSLSSSDYIEFIGEIANGFPDKQLYSDTSYQLSDVWNLESDSAAYFLTVNPSGTNKRLVDTANNVSSVSIPAEKNFMFTVGRYYRNFINNGDGVFVEQNLYLSQYGRGEGFSSRGVYSNTSPNRNKQMPQNFPSLFADTTGPAMTARINLVGNAPDARNVKLWLNNDSLTQFSMDYFSSRKMVISNIPAKKIIGDAATFITQNVTSSPDDELRVASIELQYPHLFNFGGASFFGFNIDSSSHGRYLKIANYNRSTANAVLYDIANGKRYIGDTTIPGTLQFWLEPSQTKYSLYLVRGDGSTDTIVKSLQQKQFINYAQASNQGNYLIITNPILRNGTDYIQQYSDYRSSDSGGHFNVKIVDIHQLEDQFAYGITMHPLAVKNFLRFARNNFSTTPAYAFLIGKGISYKMYRDPDIIADYNYARPETDPLTPQLNLVPTFGYPGSDNLLSSDNYSDIPSTPIGRLSAVSPVEVGAYLQKIKEYESKQRNTSLYTVSEKLWMKKILQLAGSNDKAIGYSIDSSQAKYKRIISDTLYGGDVSTFSKNINPSGYSQDLARFNYEYSQGSALVEYLGHSSSSSIDYSLDNPANYNNGGKYPLFIVNGCLAGNLFDYDVNRLNHRETLSEKFILEPERGAIGFLSSSSYGVLNYLDIFTEQYYKSMSYRSYGKGFGEIVKDGITNALNYTGTKDFYARMHAEQFAFHGDPALKMNYFSLPDYAVDSTEIFVTPDSLNVASDSFSVKVTLYNLGRASNNQVHFSLLRQYPNGKTDTAFSKILAPVESTDSLIIKLPIVSNRDKGTTILTAIINDKNVLPELNRNNNSASVKVKISAADILPVSPYNYSIVTTGTVNISASTAFAFDSATQYVLELDTTALFNSPVKTSRQIVTKGSLITFSNVPLSLNNTVYYWRVSEDSADKHWSGFSFIYRNGGNNGFEQAHFYQHTQSSFDGITVDSTSRSLNFSANKNNLFIQQAVWPYSGIEDADFSITENGSFITWSACVGSSIIFNIFDPLTLKPVLNPAHCGDSMRRYNFEYSTQSLAARKIAMDFLDNFVPNGYYVVARKIYDMGNADWAPTVWASDASILGANNSLYHRFKAQGLAIDSFNKPRTFIFVFKKNDSANYKPVSVFSQGIHDRISTSQNILMMDTTGAVTSPMFGPGKAWNKVKWFGTAGTNYTSAKLDVITIDKNGNDSVWYTIDTSQHELNISSINAATYPYVQLRMRTKDSSAKKPYQLQDWSVEFTPAPEGAIATNLGASIPDTVYYRHNIHVAFDTLKGYVIFKNISTTAFTPLKIRLTLYDTSNVAHNFTLPVTRALTSGDTLHVSFLVNATDLPQGLYNLYLEVNPDNDQPEQYHYNNFLYHYVYIDRETVLPVRLFNFTAKPLNNTSLLQWDVANELNIADYSVEFSKNGRTFTTVGDVTATVVHSVEKKYSFIHTGVINGKNYYRIKMVDKDGSYEYSPVRTVIIGNSKVLVYPNPFRTQLNITSSTSNPGTVKLFDLAGKQLLQQTFTTATTLNINHLASGTYLIQVNDGITVQSFKVTKQ